MKICMWQLNISTKSQKLTLEEITIIILNKEALNHLGIPRKIQSKVLLQITLLLQNQWFKLNVDYIRATGFSIFVMIAIKRILNMFFCVDNALKSIKSSINIKF